MAKLNTIIRADTDNAKQWVDKYIRRIEDGEIKTKSNKYIDNQWAVRTEQGKTYEVGYEDYRKNMLEELYSLADKHNKTSRVRMYVNNDGNIQLRKVRTDSRHSDAMYEVRRQKNKANDGGLILDFKSRGEQKRRKKVKVKRDTVYEMDINLKELRKYKKDDYIHLRVSKDQKESIQEICKNKNLTISEIINQTITDILTGQIQLK